MNRKKVGNKSDNYYDDDYGNDNDNDDDDNDNNNNDDNDNNDKDNDNDNDKNNNNDNDGVGYLTCGSICPAVVKRLGINDFVIRKTNIGHFYAGI